jgi:OOP family OmpA-OmpF porin
MKLLRFVFLSTITLSAVITLQACKAKKVVQPTPVAEVAPQPAPVETPKPAPAPVAQQETPPPVEKPDYNFSNIQFEFNSGILKTESYPIMDKAASAMKKDPSVRFVLNGNASAEGSAEHNMSLSVERANAVKAYLVNSGVSANSLEAKGYGESKPVADNTTEAGRTLNRRVEIKKLN